MKTRKNLVKKIWKKTSFFHNELLKPLKNIIRNINHRFYVQKIYKSLEFIFCVNCFRENFLFSLFFNFFSLCVTINIFLISLFSCLINCILYLYFMYNPIIVLYIVRVIFHSSYQRSWVALIWLVFSFWKTILSQNNF